MGQDQFIRSRMLVGDSVLEKLGGSKVAVFGIGGVGGHCCDALARAGVGEIHLFDDDQVTLSNLNRQMVALHSTVGRNKVDVMAERILDINPRCRVEAKRFFYTPETAETLDLGRYDYVVDCVDTVTAKLDLAVRCIGGGIPIISSMGSANKFDPTKFQVTDISKTEGCPLARVMRKELRKRGISHLRVVFSSEEAKVPTELEEIREDVAVSLRTGSLGHKKTPGSLPFVPAAAGLVLASAVVRELGEF